MGRKIYVRRTQRAGAKDVPAQSYASRRRWGVFHQAQEMGLNVSKTTPVATMAAMIREKRAKDREELVPRIVPAASALEQTLKGVAGTGFAVTPELTKALEESVVATEKQEIRYPWQKEPASAPAPAPEPVLFNPLVEMPAVYLEPPLTITFSPGFFSRVGEALGRALGRSFGDALAETLTQRGVAGLRETPGG